MLIHKVFITGVTPLLLSDLTGGANDWHNITFDPQYSTLCGLTQSDVLEALKAICNSEDEIEEHFRRLNFYANGYHFSKHQKVEEVFNTKTAVSYLEVSKQNYYITLRLIVISVGTYTTNQARY
jgi:hypothetical protein